MKSFAFLIFALLFTYGSAFAKVPLHYYRLENGLQVILSVNRNAPVVNQTLWYKVGSMDEPHGRSGMAHILEHLLFKGTQKYPQGYFSKLLQELGGIENASTSRYFTNYHQTIESQHLGKLLTLESDRMRNLDFSQMDAGTEIDVVYEERLSRVENNPHAILSERSSLVLYGNHPYGRPTIGWGHELLSHKLNLGGIEEFYRKFYRPSNAILVLSGDFDITESKLAIEATYGAIPRGKESERFSIIKESLPSRGRLHQELEYRHGDVSQPFFWLSLLSPSLGYNDEQDSRIDLREGDIYPLMLISDILNSPDSELQSYFIREKQTALQLGSYYSPLGRGASQFSLYFVPKERDNLREMRMALRVKLSEIAQRGFTEVSLGESKLRITDSFLLSSDSLTHYPNLAAQAILSGISFEDFLTWQDRLEQVSLSEVNEVLARYFSGEDWGGVWSFLRGE